MRDYAYILEELLHADDSLGGLVADKEKSRREANEHRENRPAEFEDLAAFMAWSKEEDRLVMAFHDAETAYENAWLLIHAVLGELVNEHAFPLGPAIGIGNGRYLSISKSPLPSVPYSYHISEKR